ncbi:MAG: DUF3307 domain-containing protein [Candidatus Omnitrophica bacterium]|nr:DUF3307 domain-containing protein [Candidatus Omnitrophota bacterium]
MFIFIRLFLAHLVGDFILQFDNIYRLKYRGLTGVIPHVLLIMASMAVFSWPYLVQPGLWIFLGFIGISHLIQDWVKANHINIKDNFWIYFLDQVLHVIAISVVFLTGLKALKPPSYNNIIVLLYNNDSLFIYAIAAILASYNGFYMVTNFKKSYLSVQCACTPFEKWYGILERFLIVSLFFLGGAYLFFLLVLAVFRPIAFSLFRKKTAIDGRFTSFREFVLSWSIALTIGTILRLTLNYLT